MHRAIEDSSLPGRCGWSSDDFPGARRRSGQSVLLSSETTEVCQTIPLGWFVQRSGPGFDSVQDWLLQRTARGASNALLDQLDRVMRASARLILQKSKYNQITADMNNRLHWLDARARIDYKLCIMAFRCLNGSAPRYLARCCVPISSVVARSHLRSAAAGELVVSACCTKTIGPRAFAVSCPTRWNALPSEMRVHNVSLAVFKKKLKTVLFSAMLDRQQHWWLTSSIFIFLNLYDCS